jgi:two-component system OmpR family response regulator
MGRIVLVVDDERFIVDLLAEVLTEEGFEVRRAYDGLAAWEDVSEVSPDLVLTDVFMPNLNGLELARRVQEKGIPVVLMSAVASGAGGPGIGFIAKPFDLEEILDVVNTVLDETPP